MIIRVALLCTAVLVVSGAKAQVPGCTDPLALNYDSSAETNDGSCMYAPTGISPYLTQELPTSLSESSGLIDWDGRFWTHNDDTDIRLYALDPQDASIADECLLAGVINQDWEDIDQDDTWIYVGDFGNNSSGNRQDLHILRIEKSTLCTGQPQIDTLWYSYEDQIDFSNQGSNTTDYDCEAMVVGADSIYLFTKQWKSLGTAVYALSKLPGDQIAELRGTWPVNGLITGATWMEKERLLALCGYSTLLQPFLYLCYDFHDGHMFSGNKRRLELTLPFHQVEGISTLDGIEYVLSNERFSQIVMVPPRLHRVDLGDYLSGYLEGLSGIHDEASYQDPVHIYREGGSLVIALQQGVSNQEVQVYDYMGRPVAFDQFQSGVLRLAIGYTMPGWMFVRVGQTVRPVYWPG